MHAQKIEEIKLALHLIIIALFVNIGKYEFFLERITCMSVLHVALRFQFYSASPCGGVVWLLSSLGHALSTLQHVIKGGDKAMCCLY